MLDNIKREGHVYRGMTDYEYQATIGANRPIRSTGKYSFESEGTNFASDPSEAESYANFGRDDPRKTGKSTWLVEVKLGADIVLGKDGYYKAADEIGLDRVSRVWKMSAEDGAVMMEQIK
jgi:hypothetical protein